MSQLTRTAPANPVAASSVPRVPAGARSVASLASTPVDELSPKVGISYEETEYLFQDFGEGKETGGHRRPPLGMSSLFGTTSETFTSFLEMFGTDGEARSTRRASAFGMTLSQAIQSYEATARISAGAAHAARGGRFSFHL